MRLLAISTSTDLFTIGISLGEKVIRTVVVYAVLVALLRVAGKREIAQLNSFDLVVLLLLSNVVQNAIIGPDNSLLGGLIGAAVLMLANAVVERAVARNDRAVAIFEGRPTVIVRDGQIDLRALEGLGLSRAEVMSAVRQQGANTLAEVAQAALEPDGKILVRLNPADENASKGDVARVEGKLDALLGRLGPTAT